RAQRCGVAPARSEGQVCGGCCFLSSRGQVRDSGCLAGFRPESWSCVFLTPTLSLVCLFTLTSLPSPAGPCGGSLFGSGTFSSPNHPNHYHNNAYCTWTLTAAYNQRVFLAFTYMELDNGCGCACDYIDVYNGPVHSYYLLGKICNDTLTSFYSTSTYMTVVFRSDSSVIARGFKAEFMSALKPSSVSCTSDTMNIVIERSYLNSLGYSSHDLYLNDEQCRPQITSYQVIFSFPIESCGNVRQVNNLLCSIFSNSSSGEITRHAVMKLNVTCIMDQDSLSENVFVIQNPGNSSIIGTGKFNTTMTFYTSSSFSYPVTEFPYEVELNKYIYVQIDLKSSDNSLVIFLDTCVASPSPHDFQTRAYYLVRNGCQVDNTYYAYNSGYWDIARFRVMTFQFLRASESVYLQCKVLVCQASDNNSRCRRGCITRRARDLGSRHDGQTLVLGPIKLKESKKEEEGTGKQGQA
uniref:CUB and zona pellucida-like domains 1, tandem duplicate 1 n=1 Tax=Salarias fasciatus TaxID=181472 RepID=A0A672H1A3_SALFA